MTDNDPRIDCTLDEGSGTWRDRPPSVPSGALHHRFRLADMAQATSLATELEKVRRVLTILKTAKSPMKYVVCALNQGDDSDDFDTAIATCPIPTQLVSDTMSERQRSLVAQLEKLGVDA